MLVGHKGRGAAAAVLLGVWVAAPAQAQDHPVEIVEGWLAAGKGYEWLTVHHDGIAHDEESDRVTIDGLSLMLSVSEEAMGDASAYYTIHFPQIALEGLAIDGDYYHATSVSADSAHMVFSAEGSGGRSRGDATYHGIEASNVWWARPPAIEDDPARPISRYYPLIAALVDISFDEMTIGGVTVLSQSSEPSMTMTADYGAMVAGPTESGNMSSMRMDGVSLHMVPDDPSTSSFEMSIGEVVLDTYNYGDLVYLLLDPDEPAGAGDAPFETVVGLATMADMHITSKDFGFRIGEYRIEDVGVRRPTVPLLERLDQLYLTSQEGGEPDQEEIIELVTSIYGALRLGLFEVRDMSGQHAETAGEFGTFGIAGLSNAGMESLYYRGLDMEQPGAFAFRLGDFTVKDVGFPALSALIDFEQARLMGDIVSMLAAFPTVGSISYSDIRAFMPGIVDIELASNTLEMSGHISSVPTRLKSSLAGFRMPVWMMEGEAAETFGALGYDELAADYDLDIAWDAASSDLAVSASAAVKDAGALSLDATLGGVPRSVFEDPRSAVFVAEMLTLVKASAMFEDRSITDRALGLFAAQQGMDPETLRAQAGAMLPFVLASLNRPTFSNMVTAAVQTFLNTKGSLSITANPAEPRPLVELMMTVEHDPGAVIDALNIEVTAQ